MDQYTRCIIGFGIQSGDVDGVTLCCMFNCAISNQGVPRYLSSDNDPLLRYHRWQANLHILEVAEIKSIPYTPTSHPYIERLIGTIRREYLDRLFFWNTQDLERKLESFAQYYNQHRAHQSLDGKTPVSANDSVYSQRANLTHYAWKSHCHALFKTQIAA
ncbi:MAG: putative transposase [Granulosicoccus sp.]|jgi:putative transposase